MIPGFDIGGREAAASELQTRSGTKVCAFKLYPWLEVGVWDGHARGQKSNYLSILTSSLFLLLPASNGLFWRWP